MKSFFEINRLWQDIVKQLEESEGELTDELAELLAINQSDVSEKIEEHVSVINMITADSANLLLEIERLNSIIKRNTATQERIKNGLIKAVKLYGKNDKLKSGVNNLSIKTGRSLQIVDALKIPKQYISYDFTVKKLLSDQVDILLNLYNPDEYKSSVIASINKMGLKNAIDEGLETDSCKIVESENLQIK